MDKSPDEPQEREELRSVVAVFRHADRTPKQKMKMSVSEKEFLQFFKYAEITKEGKIKQVKLKTPKRLQVVVIFCNLSC
jgi:inositol-hexakisphosphate/diphosphoinositol-pentakisphosphate 1-kinase